MSLITAAQLAEILPLCHDVNGWTAALNATLASYGITTNTQLAAFIGQCAEETGQFNETTENLNYSAQALVAVFPHEFPNLAFANQYAGNPTAIASIVYAPPRLGNETTLDSELYIGRGLIQLTGRNNYQLFANYMNMELSDVVAYASTQNGAVAVAGWYWSSNNLNRFCTGNAADYISLTKAINGSTTDLSGREQYWNQAVKVLGQ